MNWKRFDRKQPQFYQGKIPAFAYRMGENPVTRVRKSNVLAETEAGNTWTQDNKCYHYTNLVSIWTVLDYGTTLSANFTYYKDKERVTVDMIISTQLKMTANYTNIWNNTSFILYFVLNCCIALIDLKKLHLLKPIIFQVADGPIYNSTAIITVLLLLLLLLLLRNDTFYTVRKNLYLVTQFSLMITLLLTAISKMRVLVISFYVFLFVVWYLCNFHMFPVLSL